MITSSGSGSLLEVLKAKNGLFPDNLFMKKKLVLTVLKYYTLTYRSSNFLSRLPSAFVLHGSGLSSAPQTARVMKAVSALNSFTKIVEGEIYSFHLGKFFKRQSQFLSFHPKVLFFFG